MKHDWKDREKDMALAKQVIHQHFADSENDEISLHEWTEFLDADIHLQRADWIIELEEAFEAKYGLQEGRLVSERVMTALITQGHDIH